MDRPKLFAPQIYIDGEYSWKTYVPEVAPGDRTSVGSWIYCDDHHEIDFECGWHEFGITLDLVDGKYNIHWIIDGEEKNQQQTGFGPDEAVFRIFVSVENLMFIGTHIASQDNTGAYEWVKFKGHTIEN